MSFVAARLAQAVIVLVVVSMLVFVGVYLIGDPVRVLIDPRSSQDAIARTVAALGLDRPVWEQYLAFVSNALDGNFGVSALRLIVERLPATLELVAAALAIGALIGLPLGVIAGRSRGGFLGQMISAGSIVGFSLPSFWVGLMLIMVFCVQHHLLPSGGRGELGELFGIKTSLATLDGLRHVALPALNLSLFPAALLIRLVSLGMKENLRADFVLFARSKGLAERRVLGAYVLRNALIPVITVMGMVTGTLIAFAVVTETVFAWPGMGKLIIDSIRVLDRPVIVSYILFSVVLFTLINLAADIACVLIDPRIRMARSRS